MEKVTFSGADNEDPKKVNISNKEPLLKDKNEELVNIVTKREP